MQYNRVKWGCRRGMLELDLVLLPFVDQAYPELSPADQVLFQQLLECEDQDLYAWFLRRIEPDDAALRYIVRQILYHQHNRPLEKPGL